MEQNGGGGYVAGLSKDQDGVIISLDDGIMTATINKATYNVTTTYGALAFTPMNEPQNIPNFVMNQDGQIFLKGTNYYWYGFYAPSGESVAILENDHAKHDAWKFVESDEKKKANVKVVKEGYLEHVESGGRIYADKSALGADGYIVGLSKDKDGVKIALDENGTMTATIDKATYLITNEYAALIFIPTQAPVPAGSFVMNKGLIFLKDTNYYWYAFYGPTGEGAAILDNNHPKHDVWKFVDDQ